MGMFDRVWVPCCVCGKEVEFQSKGGDCTLTDYKADAVPADVAYDLPSTGKMSTEKCEKCGTELRVKTELPQTVRAYTVKVDS